MKVKDLHTDPSRAHLPDTGFYAVVWEEEASFADDISRLTKESLIQWLQENGVNQFGITIILSMLGHKTNDQLQYL